MEAVAVPATIDAGNALEVLDSLKERAAAGGEPLTLDLAPLTLFDSSALSLLLQLVRERSADGAAAGESARSVPAAGSGVVLLNPPPKLRELAELYGVADMLFGAVAGPAALTNGRSVDRGDVRADLTGQA